MGGYKAQSAPGNLPWRTHSCVPCRAIRGDIGRGSGKRKLSVVEPRA